MIRQIRAVVPFDLYTIGKKGQKVKTSISKNKYIVIEKVEIKKPFAFPIFQDLDLGVSRQEIQMNDENVSFLCSLPSRTFQKVAVK